VGGDWVKGGGGLMWVAEAILISKPLALAYQILHHHSFLGWQEASAGAC